MSVDDFAKLILAVAIALSIFGVSVQVMRLLGTLNDTLRDFRSVTNQIAELIKKIIGDYEDIIKVVKGIMTPIKVINKQFLVPLSELAAMAGTAVTMLRQQLFGSDYD